MQVPVPSTADQVGWYVPQGAVLAVDTLPSLEEAAISWSEETRGAYNRLSLVLRPTFNLVSRVMSLTPVY